MNTLNKQLAEALLRAKRLIPVSSDEWAEADVALAAYEASLREIECPPDPDTVDRALAYEAVESTCQANVSKSSDGIDMPPLPKPARITPAHSYKDGYYYSAYQMREYARAALAQQADEVAPAKPEYFGDGPLVDGWQLSISNGHSGYGVYAHMTDYPEEGAVFLLAATPALAQQAEPVEPVAWPTAGEIADELMSTGWHGIYDAQHAEIKRWWAGITPKLQNSVRPAAPKPEPVEPVPDGWQLVPKVPTQKMIDRGRWDEFGEDCTRAYPVPDYFVTDVWDVRFEAAPKPVWPAAAETENEKLRAWIEEAIGYVGCETWSPSLKAEGEKLLARKAHPAAAPKPLTEEQALSLWKDAHWKWETNALAFARAIEAAHGIKEQA